MRVEQVRHPVQPDRGLARARRALDADGAAEVGAHDVVLLRLDGRDDVAHRPAARTFDLGGQDPRCAVSRFGAVEQVLVLVRREAAALEAEPAAQRDPQRVGARRAVERARITSARQSTTTGSPCVVVDVAASDVPPALVGGSTTSTRPKNSGTSGSSSSALARW